MSHVMGDILISFQRSSTATKDEDADKVLTQRLEQLYDDGKRKNEVPLFYGSDAEAMIHIVREFDEVADDLEFTEAHEKFTNFGNNNVCLETNDLPEDIYEAQKNYIETVKKPYTVTVCDFVKRLRQMASYLPEFPRPMAATVLSETDLKNIIFRGMPNAWQENLVHVNMRISSITLAQMTNYLASEQLIADTRREKNTKGRGYSGRNSHNGRGYNPGQGRGYQGRSYQGRGCSSSKRSSSWMPSNKSHNEAKIDPCRYHGNAHTWLKCYGNPGDGPNYHPGFTPRPHGATGRGRGGFRGGCGNGGSNNYNAPSAASMATNHTNASGWGVGNQYANNNMQLSTIIGLIPLVCLNDARAVCSSLS
eukprot:scaffold128677_cov51-Attheya_sp.AAC.5